MNESKHPHEDTSISLDGLTIEEALKKAMDAGPYPKEPKKAPRDTNPAAPQPAPSKR